MSRNRLVVLGASGFVGTTLTERMIRRADWDVVPVIHSAGSAWRLARHGRHLAQVDIADRRALREVLRGATHVVNCTRGGRDVMIDSLSNVLSECKDVGVRRFVHLSSVLVYGDPPAAAAESESGPVDATQPEDTYGGMKLEQDQMVAAASRQGLSSIILCPPNITGPFSMYLCGMVDGLRKGSFGLVGDGEGPCNIVDVRTLAAAIESAFIAPDHVADATRMFVTDGSDTRWKDVVDELLPLTGVESVRRIDKTVLMRRIRDQQAKRPATLRGALKHLISSDVREALRQDPLLERVDRFARRSVAMLGSKLEGQIRRSIEGTTPVQLVDMLAGLQFGMCAQQLRTVRHRDDLIRKRMGFAPPIDFRTSMEDFRRWYRSMYGHGGPEWFLASRLYSA